MASRILVILAVLLLASTTLFAQTQLDYKNTGATSYFLGGANKTVADDIHRTTALDLAYVGFAYYSETMTGTVNATLSIWNAYPDDSHELIQVFTLWDLPVHGAYSYGVDITHPIGATQDLWIGVAFSDDQTGLLVGGNPSIGYSEDGFAMDEDEDGYLDHAYWFGGNPVANFYFQTAPVPENTDVPEPGAMISLGSGLIGLVAFGRRKR